MSWDEGFESGYQKAIADVLKFLKNNMELSPELQPCLQHIIKAVEEAFLP